MSTPTSPHTITATERTKRHMEYRRLGRTGVQVSKLCLGAMMFGEWGTKDHDESIRIIRQALDAGINFVDTADVYSAGESEEIVGKAVAGRRDDLVIATKVYSPMGNDPNHRGTSRRWIIAECENSLRRLRTDYIDLYQVHRPDPETDVDVTLGVLSDLVHQGKVRYIGSSTFGPSAIVEAQWVAQQRGRERFMCEQPPYSILTRASKPTCCPPAPATEWVSSRGVLSPAGGCPVDGAKVLTKCRALGPAGCPPATTCPFRPTRRSWRPSSSSSSSPRTPA